MRSAVLSSLIPLVLSVPVILPAGRDGKWNDVPTGFRYCPAVGDEYSYGRAQTTAVTILQPKSLEHEGAEGYLCHVAVYEATCDFRWYGVKYKTQKIRRQVPTDAECQSKQKALLAGRSDWVGFPSFSCNYASVTTEKHLEIVLVPHHVGIDDYLGLYVDPTLQDGSCVTPPCHTLYEDTLWLPKDPPKPGGPCDLEFHEHRGTIRYPLPRAGMSMANFQISGPTIPTATLDGACHMGVCGKWGIRLRSGVWVGVKERPMMQGMDLYETFMHPCAPNATISAGHFNPGTLKMIWDAGRLLGYSLCQKTWDKLDRGDSITPLDLSYLNPVSPGPGIGFLSINGTLKMAKLRFSRIDLPDGMIKNYNSDNPNAYQFQWQRWVPHGNVLVGPNGITLNGSTVKFPFFMVGVGRLDSDLTEAESIDLLSHHDIKHSHMLHPVDDRYDWSKSGESGDLIKHIESWFTIPDWIKYCVVVAICIILIIVLGCMILIKLRSHPTPQLRRDPEVPLSSTSFL